MLLDKLCKNKFDRFEFEKLIETQKETGYYTKRVEIFYILPPQKGSGVRYSKILESFDVPSEIINENHNTRVEVYNINFKMLLIEVLLYYNINFKELDQKKLEKLDEEILPYHNFNHLQKILYEFDSEDRFKKHFDLKIKITDKSLLKINGLIEKFIEHKKKNNQNSDVISLKSQLKWFKKFLASKKFIEFVSEIRKKDLEEYQNFLEKTKYNNSIKNKNRDNFVYRNLKAVYKFFVYLRKNKDRFEKKDIPDKSLLKKSKKTTQKSVFSNLKRNISKRLPDWADDLIFKNIMDMEETCKDEIINKTIMLLFYYSGIRLMDVCTLTKDCLLKKYDKEWIRVFSNKTLREYEIPLPDIVSNYIKKCIEINYGRPHTHPKTGKKEEFLFWKKGKFDTFRRKVYNLFLRVVSKTKYEAIKNGVKLNRVNSIKITPHSLRHNLAMKYAITGGDLLTIAKLLGHANLSMAQSYLEKDSRHIEDVFKDESHLYLLFNDSSYDDLNIKKSAREILESDFESKKVPSGWCLYEDHPPCGEYTDCKLCSEFEL